MSENSEAPITALLHYYEIRMSALSVYSELVWNRFNWLLTLQVAIASFFLTRHGDEAVGVVQTWRVPAVGMTVSIVWGLMGLGDFRSLQRIRGKTKQINRELQKLFPHHVALPGSGELNPHKPSQTWLLFCLPAFTAVLWVVLAVWS